MSRAPADKPPPRMMICDDDQGYRSLVRIVLGSQSSSSIEFSESADGQECLEKVSSDPVDYILLDLNMPGVDSYEALPRLHRLAPDTKIVVLSSATADGRELRSLGAHGYVEKPRDVFGLRDAICATLAE